MKLFALPDGVIDRKDRAQWLTSPFSRSTRSTNKCDHCTVLVGTCDNERIRAIGYDPPNAWCEESGNEYGGLWRTTYLASGVAAAKNAVCSVYPGDFTTSLPSS